MFKSTKPIYVLGLLIRIILFLIGVYMDKFTETDYSDIDYRIFTDGARYVTEGKSPFERTTYRYTPLLAIMMTPNIYISEYFGKIFFISLDILVGFMIEALIQTNSLKSKMIMLMIWFFNPVTINCSTRGSNDVIVTVLMLACLYFLKKDRLTISAIIYGLTVHFRIFPIIYCMAIYMYIKKNKSFINLESIKYGVISGSVFILITAFFYIFYGYQYLYEGYLYHLVRKDHRHNFSI